MLVVSLAAPVAAQTVPVDPDTGAPVDPQNPADPADPQDAGDPADPTDAGDPTPDPVADPATPSDPADPVTAEDTPGFENDDRDSNDRPLGQTAERRTRPGRTEFLTVGPPEQAQAVANALAQANARPIRTREFPALGLYAVFYDLNGLSPSTAQQIVRAIAPQTAFDIHAIYRLVQGKPRLYAASMINAQGQACALGGLRIGLIDGAVDPTHPALSGARVFTHSVLEGAATNPGHGTAVAALIAGRDPAGALSGFASGADLYSVTAFGSDRGGPAADVERLGIALDWLIAHDVRLINMSFAGPRNMGLEVLLRAAAARGAVMIAAAGNDGSSVAAYPAGSDSVIAVTAVDAAGRRYVAANTGPHIEFAAPGVDLYVAGRRGGSYASGTSYAAPIITALAARLMARGVRSVDGIRARLREQSSDLGTPGRDTSFGWGLVRDPGC
ncbi:S8 family serine peptidase [Pseudoruegeria sp. HB172150]|uniref:S8 family serine peptidase n=1 Tax=Pseudoruegeria sp. HB172150 TaxID=2721164 RepID=UPI001C1314CE|nr:S8 family serine peptidase [Pseudoruegeria sp. HB172150]